ncbi:hypothetical protein D3C73_565670 [compost metagenome]
MTPANLRHPIDEVEQHFGHDGADRLQCILLLQLLNIEITQRKRILLVHSSFNCSSTDQSDSRNHQVLLAANPAPLGQHAKLVLGNNGFRDECSYSFPLSVAHVMQHNALMGQVGMQHTAATSSRQLGIWLFLLHNRFRHRHAIR